MICLFLLVFPAIAGCPEKPGTESVSESLPFAGQAIRIGVPPEMGFRSAWEGPLNEWEAQSGAKYGLDEIPQAGAADPFTAFSGELPQTLALFPLERAGELIAAGQLAPLPASVRSEGGEGVNWQDVFRGLRERIGARKGEPMFLPLAAPVLVCYFRQDLLRAAGIQPPQTWDDYQQLLDTLERWAPGLTAVEPWSEEFRTTMFLARAVSAAQHPGNYSLYFDIDTGEPLIDGPAFVQSLDLVQRALAKMPREVLSYSTAECRAELLRGKAALAIACEPTGADAGHEPEVAATSNGAIEIGVVRLPGAREVYDASRRLWEPLPDKSVSHVTLAAFSGWGIGASSRSTRIQVEAAWNALLKVAGPDAVSGFPGSVRGFCRESQLLNGDFGSALPGDASGSYVNAVAISLREPRLVAELPVVGRNEFRQALSRALESAINGSKSAEGALQAAAAEWREIIARIGPARHRDNYRSSLGLSPKPN